MKTSAAVIAALFASVEAINIRQLGFMKASEELNGPAVGNEFTRFCEQGATATDGNIQGCLLDKEHLPLRSTKRAADWNIPDSGKKDLNFNKQTPNEKPSSLPRPNTVHNLTDSPNGMVSIPFAYVQTSGDAQPSPVDPSKAATEDPIKLEAEKLAKANKDTPLTEGNEHEAKKAVESPEEKKKVETEEAQSKAQGAAVKVLEAATAAKPDPLEADNKQGWDSRASNDAARTAADKTVSAQNKDENTRVAENKKIVDTATAESAKVTNVNNRAREGASANNWHEYWVTNVVPQPTPNDYSAPHELRAGEPTKGEKEAAKANGPSEKETKAQDDAKKDAAPAKEAAAAPAKSLAQLKSKADPPLSKQHADELEYQKTWQAEQARLKAAKGALIDNIGATEQYKLEHAVNLAQPAPSKQQADELEYQKVWQAEQARLKAAHGALSDQIGANEQYRQTHAVTLVQVKGKPSLADSEEAAYQKIWAAEQTRLKAAQKTLADQITANEKFRTEHPVTLVQLQGKPSLADSEEAAYQKIYDAEQTRLKAAQKTLADQITANEKFRTEHAVTL